MAKFNRQAPDQYTGRNQLDHAVEPESDQHKAAGCNSGCERHHSLDNHPADCQPFEAEHLANELRAVDLRLRWQNERGRGATAVLTRLRDLLCLYHAAFHRPSNIQLRSNISAAAAEDMDFRAAVTPPKGHHRNFEVVEMS